MKTWRVYLCLRVGVVLCCSKQPLLAVARHSSSLSPSWDGQCSSAGSRPECVCVCAMCHHSSGSGRAASGWSLTDMETSGAFGCRRGPALIADRVVTDALQTGINLTNRTADRNLSKVNACLPERAFPLLRMRLMAAVLPVLDCPQHDRQHSGDGLETGPSQG